MDVRPPHTWTREDLLYFPPVLAAISVVYVAFKLGRVSMKKDAEVNIDEYTGDGKNGSLLERFDGAAIILFRVLRLLTVLALLSLEVFELSVGTGPSARVFQTPFFVCPLTLSMSLY